MKTIDTLIIGATFAGIGLAMRLGETGMLLERTTLVGHEFINSYRPGDGWESLPQQQLTNELREVWLDRHLLTDEGRVHLGGIAPTVYKLLLDSGQAVCLMTEVIEITRQHHGFEVTLYDAAGFRTLHATHIIDTTSDCRSARGRVPIKAKSLGAVLHYSGQANGQELRHLTDVAWVQGAYATETYIQLALEPEASWSDARKKLHDSWSGRASELKDWTIAAVADELTFNVSEPFRELEPGWVWLPSCAHSNPLQAMDAGFAYGERMVQL